MIGNESQRTPAVHAPQGVLLRAPSAQDGHRIYGALKLWGGLDLNSTYACLLMCDRFAAQSALAEVEGQLVGFVVGLATCEAPGALFVWQVGVAPEMRGQRIGRTLIDHILKRDTARYRYVEAHVGPNNAASMRLFESIARDLKAPFAAHEDYPAAWFPAGHDAEHLVRIGPLPAAAHPSAP